jgi:lipopolysaccharide export system protein LptA
MSLLRPDGALQTAALALLLALGASAQAATADREQPIDVLASTGDATLADGDSILRGEVMITQGSLEIRADTAVLSRLAGEVSQVVFEGAPASLQQVDDRGAPVKVRARKVTYRPASNQVVLEGDVEVEQPQGTLRGERVTYDMGSGRLNAEGGASERIRMRIEPRQPAATPPAGSTP